MEMGASASKPPSGLVVTLDALGTIYKFREPISTQYVKVARKCGVKAPIDEKDLMKAFKSSFKEISAEYPNYGKGQLKSARSWWKSLTNDTFRKVVDESEIPEQLPDELYDHFTSSAAYELYPDVKPFFESIRQLKEQYPQPRDPGIFVGVISNGDPRVKGILQSLGLRVGLESIPQIESIRDRAHRITSEYFDVAKSPWHDAYNRLHDVDMLVTSYEVGSEKPDPKPFLQAESLAKMNYISRLEQEREDWTPGLEVMKFKAKIAKEASSFDNAKCIHIGDDYDKDYVGAVNAGFEALHLAREGEQLPGPEGTSVVRDLEEAAMAIRIMAVENLGSHDRDA